MMLRLGDTRPSSIVGGAAKKFDISFFKLITLLDIIFHEHEQFSFAMYLLLRTIKIKI